MLCINAPCYVVRDSQSSVLPSERLFYAHRQWPTSSKALHLGACPGSEAGE